MRTLSLLIFTLFCTISAMAQPWLGNFPGNIYYNSGNVGIGTISPRTRLMVTAASNNGIPSLGTASEGTTFTAIDGLYGLNLGIDPTGFSWMQAMRFDGIAMAYAIALQPSGGNVGIGTTTPGATLDIKGAQTVAGTGLRFSSTNPLYYWDLHRENLTTGNMFWDETFNNVTTNRFTIQANTGNVGIGTTTPEAKLTVKGKIVASEIQVKADNLIIPDYVFKSDYELMPLSHVEEFVKLNQHLPEMPSEQEFKENGMNMAEMNALLLKKIEELTLYAIKQNKKVEEQSLYSIEQNKSLDEQAKKNEELAKKIESLEKAVNILISK